MPAITPFGFRAPPAIKALLDKSADQSGRSINNQLLQYCIQGLRLDGFNIPKIKKQRPAVVAAGRLEFRPKSLNNGETHETV